jgi:hypothetical protein
VGRNIPERNPEQFPLYTIAGQTEKGILTTISFGRRKELCHHRSTSGLPENRQRSAAEIAEAVRKQIAQIPEIEKFHVTEEVCFHQPSLEM